MNTGSSRIRMHCRMKIALRVGAAWLALSVASAQQGQFSGSVPAGTASPTPLRLTLDDAINRALRTNLGLLVSETASDSARGQRIRALSALLPQLYGQVTETAEQLNLKTFGFPTNVPGLPIPAIVGPFQYIDVRAYGQWAAYDYNLRKTYQSSRQSERAAQLSVQDARDLTVQAVANGYFLIIADASRVESIKAQVETAQALYDQAVDRQTAGTAAGIDVLRAQVELKQQQQRLLAQTNQFDKDKLALGRIIGLPPAQDFLIAEEVPFAPLTSITQGEALETALAQRRDYQSSKAQVRAAEDAVKAARGERYPTAQINADYGVIGPALDNSHGTFTMTASARVNIFDAGRIKGDIVQAKAALQQREDELADLGAQINVEVRDAFLDLRTAADLVAVARDNLVLANQTLIQSRDRFAAGVTDNIEVVQAQDSVATANDSLIAALYSHNVAKAALARALGGAEQGVRKIVEGK
jgi:outer membrane protein TolC